MIYGTFKDIVINEVLFIKRQISSRYFIHQASAFWRKLVLLFPPIVFNIE